MNKEDSPHAVLEESGIAFDPGTQSVDLSKEEKRRTTALMMAIQAYQQLIIKEAAYLKEAADLARRNEGPALKPATIDAMIDAAWKFDMFISGEYHEAAEEDSTASTSQTKSSPQQPDQQ